MLHIWDSCTITGSYYGLIYLLGDIHMVSWHESEATSSIVLYNANVQCIVGQMIQRSEHDRVILWASILLIISTTKMFIVSEAIMYY